MNMEVNRAQAGVERTRPCPGMLVGVSSQGCPYFTMLGVSGEFRYSLNTRVFLDLNVKFASGLCFLSLTQEMEWRSG